jgi:uncharacterized protein YjiS (DUF1127 family)
MTTMDHATCTAQHAQAPALLGRAATAVSSLWRAFRNRRALRRLDEMSDAALADIGLTRADLGPASDRRFGEDPTVRLGIVAAERIRRTEALARQVH